MNRQKRQQQILDAALKVFARQGYGRTNVSDLVKEARVSRGTFYLYFKSKKEIFDCLIDKFMGEILNIISLFDAAQFRKTQIHDNSLCHDLAVCLAKYRLLARIIIVDAKGLAGSHRIKIDAYMKQLYRVLEHNLNHGARTGVFQQVDFSLVSHCLVGAIKEFLMEWTDNNHSFDFEHKVTDLMRFIFTSISSDRDSTHGQNILDQDGDYLDSSISNMS